MIFISFDDFFIKAKGQNRLSFQEEKALAHKINKGEEEALEKLLNSYSFYIASCIKRHGEEFCTLDFLYRCTSEIKKEAIKHNFSIENNDFTKKISMIIKKKIVEKIAEN